MTVPDRDTADRIIFSGKFPTGCSNYILSRTVLTHKTYAFGLFKSIWQQLGGSIAGQVRTAMAPATDKPFLVRHSKSLPDVIKLINKFSNNVMSRQLVLTLGAELQEQPGTTEKGARVIDGYLTDIGLDTQTLKIKNGAGTVKRGARLGKIAGGYPGPCLDHTQPAGVHILIIHNRCGRHGKKPSEIQTGFGLCAYQDRYDR